MKWYVAEKVTLICLLLWISSFPISILCQLTGMICCFQSLLAFAWRIFHIVALLQFAWKLTVFLNIYIYMYTNCYYDVWGCMCCKWLFNYICTNVWKYFNAVILISSLHSKPVKLIKLWFSPFLKYRGNIQWLLIKATKYLS